MKPVFRFRSYLLLACLSIASFIQPYALFFDMGGVLVNTDKLAVAREIGLGKFLGYLVGDRKNPAKLQDLVFDVLSYVDGDQRPTTESWFATTKGKRLPEVMCSWLRGDQRPRDILTAAQHTVSELGRTGYFCSAREQDLVSRTLKAIFDPKTLAPNTKPLKDGLKLLKKCAKKKKHQIFILSNWDAESFALVRNDKRFKDIFDCVSDDHVIVSGVIHIIKPDPAIFKFVTTKFKLKPADCVLIDDQEENLAGAAFSGWKTVHVRNGNFKQAEKDLLRLGVFN